MTKQRIVSCVKRGRGVGRRGWRKSLCLLAFLILSSTRPQWPGDTSLNLKSKLAPCCGNLIQFPLFREGQTQATPSLLIAYTAIKSHRGLSFSLRRVTTCWLTRRPLRSSKVVKISVNLREGGRDWTLRGQTSLFPGNHR